VGFLVLVVVAAGSFIIIIVLFMTWRSRAAGMSSVSAKERGSAGVLTLDPGDMASRGEVGTTAVGGGGENKALHVMVGTCFQIWVRPDCGTDGVGYHYLMFLW
jgi:hypothetical protein